MDSNARPKCLTSLPGAFDGRWPRAVLALAGGVRRGAGARAARSLGGARAHDDVLRRLEARETCPQPVRERGTRTVTRGRLGSALVQEHLEPEMPLQDVTQARCREIEQVMPGVVMLAARLALQSDAAEQRLQPRRERADVGHTDVDDAAVVHERADVPQVGRRILEVLEDLVHEDAAEARSAEIEREQVARQDRDA